MYTVYCFEISSRKENKNMEANDNTQESSEKLRLITLFFKPEN